jgi:hypothetical protein
MYFTYLGLTYEIRTAEWAGAIENGKTGPNDASDVSFGPYVKFFSFSFDFFHC